MVSIGSLYGKVWLGESEKREFELLRGLGRGLFYGRTKLDLMYGRIKPVGPFIEKCRSVAW
jgi:hypothetical protein